MTISDKFHEIPASVVRENLEVLGSFLKGEIPVTSADSDSLKKVNSVFSKLWGAFDPKKVENTYRSAELICGREKNAYIYPDPEVLRQDILLIKAVIPQSFAGLKVLEATYREGAKSAYINSEHILLTANALEKIYETYYGRFSHETLLEEFHHKERSISQLISLFDRKKSSAGGSLANSKLKEPKSEKKLEIPPLKREEAPKKGVAPTISMKEVMEASFRTKSFDSGKYENLYEKLREEKEKTMSKAGRFSEVEQRISDIGKKKREELNSLNSLNENEPNDKKEEGVSDGWSYNSFSESDEKISPLRQEDFSKKPFYSSASTLYAMPILKPSEIVKPSFLDIRALRRLEGIRTCTALSSTTSELTNSYFSEDLDNLETEFDKTEDSFKDVTPLKKGQKKGRIFQKVRDFIKGRKVNGKNC